MWKDIDMPGEDEVQPEGTVELETMQQAESAHPNDIADMGISQAFLQVARLHHRMAAVEQRLAELLERPSQRESRGHN